MPGSEGAMEALRVLVVDDHRVFAEALATVLCAEPGIESSGAETVDAALELARVECPHVVLMDILLAHGDRFEGTKRLLEVCPDTSIIALTGLDTEEIHEAIDAGVSGLISKSDPLNELVDVIRRAAVGELVLPSTGGRTLLRNLQAARRAREQAAAMTAQLTPREIEILQALTDGRSTDEIAEELSISRHTVHGHVGSILSKLGARSKLEAVLFALRHDVVAL